MKTRLPLVGIVADFRILSRHPFHCVGNKYVEAVAFGAQTLPVLLPALAERTDYDAVLDLVDGLLFTGSPSNVAPERYGSEIASAELAETMDHARDATTLPLIRRALEWGVPVLGLCRGFQEINVALGGTLHQEVHEVDGLNDHRENEEADLEEQYGPSHPVAFTAGGLLERLTGTHQAVVNSLHGQGVARLAPGLAVEARAPDGLVEAFRPEKAPGFMLAVQWHPEWRYQENPVSVAIFSAFGEACRARQRARSEDATAPGRMPEQAF